LFNINKDYLSIKILRRVESDKEIGLCDAVNMIEVRFNDHRYFYTLASLIIDGNLITNMDHEQISKHNNELAKMLYARSLPENDVRSDGIAQINGIGWNNRIVLACTPKTEMFFHELQTKRRDRIVTILIAVLIAIISARITAYLRKC